MEINNAKMVVKSNILILDGISNIDFEEIAFSSRCSNVSTFHGDDLLNLAEKQSLSSLERRNRVFPKVVTAFAVMFFLTFFAVIIFTLAINKRIDAESN
jgi:hypothetical protein